MSDVQTESRRQAGATRRDQLLNRLQQLSRTNQANAYAAVAQMLLKEMEPVELVSALLSQVAAQPSTTPIVSGGAPNRRADVPRMA